MKISTIFFDLGKVLIDYDFNLAAYRVAQRSHLDAEKILEGIYPPELIAAYEGGKITCQDFFTQSKELTAFDGTWEELHDVWIDIFSPMDDHIQMARQLAQYYPLGLISNISESHVRYVESHFDFFPIFRKLFYSCRVGHVKPHPEIYQYALAEMKADRFETLFIDDKEENIMAASKMGWQTIHLRPDVNLKHALQSYDLKGV